MERVHLSWNGEAGACEFYGLDVAFAGDHASRRDGTRKSPSDLRGIH